MEAKFLKLQIHYLAEAVRSALRDNKDGNFDRAAANDWFVRLARIRKELEGGYAQLFSDLPKRQPSPLLSEGRIFRENLERLVQDCEYYRGVLDDFTNEAGGTMSGNKSSSQETFADVIARLDGLEMQTAVSVLGVRPCPAPSWDPHHTYRVALVGDTPTVQRLLNGEWVNAPIEPPLGYDNQLPTQQRQRTTQTRLFISHSSEDVELAKQFVSLVDDALTVPTDAMRCTSVHGYKLEPGSDGPDELRANLRDAFVVVGLLTKWSLHSAYVLMELGAAWGLETWTVPLLADGVSFADLPGPLARGTHAVQILDAAGVASLLETIEVRCRMPWRIDAARRQALIAEFATRAKADVRS